MKRILFLLTVSAVLVLLLSPAALARQHMGGMMAASPTASATASPAATASPTATATATASPTATATASPTATATALPTTGGSPIVLPVTLAARRLWRWSADVGAA
jgi:hypothetical protein